MEQYYDAPMSEAAEERCKYTARQTYNDIMSIVLNNDTDMSELIECLQRVSYVLVHEMHMVRNAKSDLNIEMQFTKTLEEQGSDELRKVVDLSREEAKKQADKWGIPVEMSDFLVNFNQNQCFSDLEHPPKNHERRFTPPSGRASPLLRTSSESINLPPRPQSIGPISESKRKLYPNMPELRTVNRNHFENAKTYSTESPEIERAKYEKQLQITIGALRHRMFALKKMQDSFDPKKAASLERSDVQLAIMYCVYYSRGVRSMFNEEKHNMRPIEWAPVRQNKVFPFSCALNYATENYHIALSQINMKPSDPIEQTKTDDAWKNFKLKYLARMWHMHSVNWVPDIEDKHLEYSLKRSASFSLSSSGSGFKHARTQSMN